VRIRITHRKRRWVGETIRRYNTEGPDALAQFADEIGVNEKQVLLVDGAPSHTSGSLKVPVGIHLVYQPVYSLEVQPSEARGSIRKKLGS